jgi:chaperonin cofactor prefoldin
MKLKDLIEKLNQFPEDMEVVRDIGGMLYDREIDLEVVTATVHPAELIEPNEYTLYHKEEDDDYWNFQRVNTDVLLIY